MKEDQSTMPSEKAALEAGAGTDTGGYTRPRYSIGARLYKRNDPACFGSVIDRYVEGGQWIYRIMGSDTRPEDVAEIDLALK